MGTSREARGVMPHVTELRNVKRVYLIGIGGTAMASLAGMLQERGYEVAGSDEHVYPPMSTYLDRLGISVLEGYTKDHLVTFHPDLVVIAQVAIDAKRDLQILERRGPSADHPVAVACRESSYLKCIVSRAL